MCPESNQLIDRINGVNGLVDGVLPSSELTRRVDIMWLDVRCEMFLRLCVELDHCIC